MSNLNLNKVIIGGRLSTFPEQRQTPQGTPVCTFSIAVNRKGKDGQADFFNVTAWRQTAEIVSKYFKKGSSIALVGSIQTRTWTDSQGNKRNAFEIVADEVYFVDSKSESEGNDFPTYTPTASEPKYEKLSAEDDNLPF